MRPDAPIWRFAHVVVICGTLLALQVLTATHYDIAVDGEPGTLVGVAAAALLLELRRRP